MLHVEHWLLQKFQFQKIEIRHGYNLEEMATQEEMCTTQLEEISNENTEQKKHGDIEELVDFKDTALNQLLRPLILLMKVFGIFYYGPKSRKCSWKSVASSIYPMAFITFNSFVIVNNLLVITRLTQPLLKVLALTIFSIGINMQSICFYITRFSCSNYFVDFLYKYKGFRSHTKRQRYIVIVIMTLFIVIDMSVFLWTVLSVYLSPPMELLTMKDISILPLPSTKVWIAFYHSIVSFIDFHGTFAGNLLLQQYCIICAFLIIEIKYWNTSFSQNVTEDGSFTGSLENYRLQYARLISLIEKADMFLSSYTAVIMSFTVPTLCFIIYLVTNGTLGSNDLFASMASLTYISVCLCVVFTAGCLLNGEVSTCFFVYFLGKNLPPLF